MATIALLGSSRKTGWTFRLRNNPMKISDSVRMSKVALDAILLLRSIFFKIERHFVLLCKKMQKIGSVLVIQGLKLTL
jgi:hypothetical protein